MLKEDMRMKTNQLMSVVEQSKKEAETAEKNLDKGMKDCEREVCLYNWTNTMIEYL